MTDSPSIDVHPGRCGGRPVIAGTRIWVDSIVGAYERGISEEEIVEWWPITPAMLRLCLWYAATWGRKKHRKRWGRWASEWQGSRIWDAPLPERKEGK